MGINIYLTFNGNCREAMEFYQRCLGGELKFQTIGNTPLVEKLPAKMRAYILNAELVRKDLLIMASDMVGDSGLLVGNAIAIMLNCNSEEELKDCYNKLAVGGIQLQSIALTSWNILLGALTDKYGHNWMLYYQPAAYRDIQLRDRTDFIT